MQPYFKHELLVGLSIIFGGILVFGITSFLLSVDIDTQAKEAAFARALIAERGAAFGALAELKQGASEAARYKEAMNKILVTQDQLIDFPRWREGLARGRGLSFSFSFQGGPTGASDSLPAYIPFSMRAAGGQENIIGFLKEVELQSPRFLINLETFSVRGGGGGYEFSGNGKVFFRE